MGHETETVIDLVTCASDLVDRHRALPAAHSGVLCEVAMMRDAVRASASSCGDSTLAADLDEVAGELDALLRRLERLPEPVPALTGS